MEEDRSSARSDWRWAPRDLQSVAEASSELEAQSGRAFKDQQLQQQSSVELSTVSEASEELSCVGQSARSSARTSARSQVAVPVADRRMGAAAPDVKPPAEHTEQDLAELTLRSQCSEAAIGELFSESLPDRGTDLSEPSSASASVATSRSSAAARRRRSMESMTGSRLLPVQGQPPATAMSSRSPPVDCPYVHDIQPLATPPPASLPSASGSSGHQAAILKRLSHDDTMEAIEDDVEGEEQELKLQAIESIAPPAGFSNSGTEPAERSLTPAAGSIQEVDEDEDEDEDEGEEGEGEGEDEESSISVSQQHGLVVQTETSERSSKRSRCQRMRSSEPLDSNSSASSESASSASSKSSSKSTNTTRTPTEQSQREPLLEGRRDQEEDDNTDAERTPVKSPLGAPPAAKLATGSSSESATQAIVEHLSRHHPEVSPPVDEPAPGLEQSRSVAELRREGWRRSSGSRRNSGRLEHDCEPAQVSSEQVAAGGHQREGSVELPMASTSRTGTMKRRPARERQAEPEVARELAGEDESAGPLKLRRGPPLSQLKQPATGAQEPPSSTRLPAAAVGSVEPADTSICSSCSCMEASFEQVAPSVEAGAATVWPMAGKPSSSSSSQQLQAEPQQHQHQHQHQQQQQQQQLQHQQQQQHQQSRQSRGQWMSQEEGTVFTENYWLSHWLYISEHEEAEIWRRPIDMGRAAGPSARPLAEEEPPGQAEASGMPKDMTETGSTSSERNFGARYKSTTRKMIHRRATIEMYKRIMSNNLKREKRVEISRSNGEFGFRIHGSRPVVVSAIERGTSAESCGLQVGDLIYAINGTNILDMAHSDVVRLAHSGKCFVFVSISFPFPLPPLLCLAPSGHVRPDWAPNPILPPHLTRAHLLTGSVLRPSDEPISRLQTNETKQTKRNGTEQTNRCPLITCPAPTADSAALVLDLVPTNDFLRMSKYAKGANKRFEATVTGYLMRLSSSTAQPLLVELQEQIAQVTGVSSQQRAARLNEVMRLAWRRRYFVLRSDNCLYWYARPTVSSSSSC